MKSSRLSLASLSAVTAIAICSLGGLVSPMTEVGMNATNRNSTNVTNGVDKSIPRRTTSANRSIASIRGMSGVPTYGDKRPGGPGWSNRQVQRMARKKRAVKSNRKNHR